HTYTQGVYQIRAYTEWNKNFGADFIAVRYVHLFPTSAEIDRTPITALQLHENTPGGYALYAQLMPRMIDSAHRKDLTAFLTVGQHRDTLHVKEARGGSYVLKYPLPTGAVLATLTIETQHGKRFTRTVSVAPDSLDFQCFAESGQLVQGIESRVGVRLRNGLGSGVAASGRVIDSRGDTVASFRTNHLGIGSFALTPAPRLTYHVVLDGGAAGGSLRRYPLPAVAD